MTTRIVSSLALVAAVAAWPASAAPIVVDFTVPGFGPPSPTQVFARAPAGAVPGLTFEALDAGLSPAGLLHWDADDGMGYADGFGVAGAGHAADEVEGPERLRLTFSSAVWLAGFYVTDLFLEDETHGTGLPICPGVGGPCYLERGAYSLDGAAWVWFEADPLQVRVVTNGWRYVPVGARASGLVLSAPGLVDVAGHQQLHEFSLAGVRLEAVPEPATLALVGAGLALVARARRWRR